MSSPAETLIDPCAAAAVAVPFAAAAAIFLFGRRGRAELFTYAAAAAAAVLVGSFLPGIRKGMEFEYRLLRILPGVDLAFRVDALGLTFALLAAGLWIVTSIYSSGYVRAEGLRNRERYFACFAASIGSALGIAFAGNLVTFLIFYEMLTLATYPLVLHSETPEAAAASRRYLAYTISGGLSLTVAAVWTWIIAGSLEFTPGGFLHGRGSAGSLAPLLALFLLGCGVKAAIMPLHAWLPSAMVAPAPVSALLHAVAVVKAGVFGCIRVLGFVFGPRSLEGSAMPAVLIAACVATVVLGSLAALAQDNLKRRLAYSTITNLSYIVLGAALLAPEGMRGAVMHLANHGFAKITLFFCAGAIHAAAHVENVSELKGLGRRMPWTFAAFTVGALALMGLPGLCGFWGKFLIARGAAGSSRIAALGFLAGGGLLAALYLVPILRNAYLEPGPKSGSSREAPALLLVPILATAALVVIFGVVQAVVEVQSDLAARVAAGVFGGTP